MTNSQSRAETIREAFLNALRIEGASVQKVRDLANNTQNFEMRNLLLDLGKASREVYSVSGVGIINIHIRSEPPGWWNIIKTVEKDFEYLSALQINCY